MKGHEALTNLPHPTVLAPRSIACRAAGALTCPPPPSMSLQDAGLEACAVQTQRGFLQQLGTPRGPAQESCRRTRLFRPCERGRLAHEVMLCPFGSRAYLLLLARDVNRHEWIGGGGGDYWMEQNQSFERMERKGKKCVLLILSFSMLLLGQQKRRLWKSPGRSGKGTARSRTPAARSTQSSTQMREDAFQ